jgi:hypothetical protein
VLEHQHLREPKSSFTHRAVGNARSLARTSASNWYLTERCTSAADVPENLPTQVTVVPQTIRGPTLTLYGTGPAPTADSQLGATLPCIRFIKQEYVGGCALRILHILRVIMILICMIAYQYPTRRILQIASSSLHCLPICICLFCLPSIWERTAEVCAWHGHKGRVLP